MSFGMTDEQWRVVWQTYQRAQVLPEREWQAFVSRAAPSQEVAARVLALLNESGSVSGPPAQPPTARRLVATGQRIGRYAVTGVLGRGGMGDVFSAEDSDLHRTVALKVLRPVAGSDDAGAAEAFFREARAASALNHPNIVTVHEVIHEDTVMAIAMELVGGESLRTLCDTPQPMTKVLQIGQQVAAALAEAHGAGLVHRDVKPENVMVRADGYVKVLDFGLARRFETAVTDPGAGPVGTLRYMSPEQIRGHRVDPASDVFSFGLVLYEMAAGAHAFARNAPLQTMLAIDSSEPTPLRRVNPGVPAAFEALIDRMLNKDRSRRPSAAEVARELGVIERRLAERPVAAPGLGQPRRMKFLALAVAVPVLSVAGWILLPARPSAVPVPLEVVPFTTEAGYENEAAISPDGLRVAYTSSQRGGSQGIFIKNIEGGASQQVAGTGGSDGNPVWSPDGRSLAFLRRRREGSHAFDLLVKPANGGPDRVVASLRTVFDSALTWAPGGQWLVVACNEASERKMALYAIPLDGGNWQRLTDPPANADPFGDRTPAFSPDGKMLAFSRTLAFASSDVFVMPVNSQLKPTGPPVRIDTGREYTTQPVWLPGGRELVVSAGTQRERRLYRIGAASGAKLIPLAGAGEFGYAPAVGPGSATGEATLIYTRRLRSSNLYWRPLVYDQSGLPSVPKGDARRLAPSSAISEHPHLSRDGRKVAFVSDRTGSLQVWSADVETGAETRWTSMDCPTLAVPRWSPDGRQITFTANCGKQTDVYVIAAPGLPPLRLTDSPSLDENSTFSPDGQWVYFTSHREEGERIWRVAVTGGPAEPVTRQVSSLAAFSHNGASLYFTGRWHDGISVWSMPAAGGEAKLVLTDVSYFVPLPKGLLYSRGSGGMAYFPFATGKSLPVTGIPAWDYVFSSPPDGSALVISYDDFSATDLMMLRNFR